VAWRDSPIPDISTLTRELGNIFAKKYKDVLRRHGQWRIVYMCFLPAAMERLKGRVVM